MSWMTTEWETRRRESPREARLSYERGTGFGDLQAASLAEPGFANALGRDRGPIRPQR